MSLPKLDLFILSYNRADYLTETLDSIFAQTFKDFRVIVLDNASTDHTADVVKNYDVEFLPTDENIGGYNNLLRIKKLASAEWVMAFHDDDLMHSGYLDALFSMVENVPDCAIASSNQRGICNPSLSELSSHRFGPRHWYFKNAAHFASFCMTLNHISYASCMYKREAFMLLRNDGLPEFGKIGDRPVMINACKGGSAVVLKDPYIDYREHAGQDSLTVSSGPYRKEAIALVNYYKSVMGTDWKTSWGKSFVVNNRAYLKYLYKWVSDGKDRTFDQFVFDAYRSGAATKWVFIPRPFMRLVKKRLLKIDPDFF